MNSVNEKFGTQLRVKAIALDAFGNIILYEVAAKDNHDNDFIYMSKFQTSLLNLKELLQGKLYFSKTQIKDLYINIHKYKGETSTNLDILIDAFDNGEEGDGKFRLKSNKIILDNGHLIISDDHNEHPVAVDFKNINASIKNFFIKGPEIYATILNSDFDDHWGMEVKKLTGDFSHTKTSMGIQNFELATQRSAVKGNLNFTFEVGDMKYFTDKVHWDFDIEKAILNTTDLNHFANEFASERKVYIKGKVEGMMNDLSMKNVHLVDGGYTYVLGQFKFKNVFDQEKPFWMRADLTRLQTTRNSLVSLMPEMLSEKLPVELGNLGVVDVHGEIEMTKRTLNTDIQVITSVGMAVAEIDIDNLNDADKALYKGNIILNKFNLGEFIKDNKFGLASVDIDVDGQGFNQKSLNTSVKGEIFSLAFGQYNYQNISVDGLMKMPYYRGLIHAEDPNLQLDFNGVIDLSSKVKNYDFRADVAHADLHALKLVNDSIAKFCGSFEFAASGNTIDDLAGEFKMYSSTYDNSKDHYDFEEFSLVSSFKGEERTITVNSKEAIQGYITGKFSFKEAKALFTNALGSLYTNYSPYEVKAGQYLDFDITVHNRLIEIFLPYLTVSEQTRVSGIINNDEKEFKLDFNSPGIELNGVSFFNVLLNVNNANPLYNAYVTIDSVKTKGYSIQDFNLLNLTHNDTLFIRSEFTGGNKKLDKFNLNLYHTINDENLSVVGFKKSELFFKDYQWNINEHEEDNNKIVFNKKLTDFVIDSLSISHNHQEVSLSGIVRDSTYKHFDLSFLNVDLSKITPDINNLKFAGNIDGEIHFSQEKEVFHPKANLIIDSLKVNGALLGDLNFKVDGDERLEKFQVQSQIVKNDEEKFYLNGDIKVIDKKSYLNLESGFNKFSMKPIGPLLSSIVSDVRGNATGKISILGTPQSPDINGRLYLNEAGMKSKFTGVDYNFEEQTPLDITEKQFIFRQVKLIDSKYKTEGIVNGEVAHKVFNDWVLDLNMTSSNLLALDTEYTEGSIYYGRAFINGQAKIVGPVQLLSIDINATSNKGTSIKIPLKEAQGTGDKNFIHFLSPKEKELRLKGEDTDIYRYENSGIELDFEFVLTPDAEIEIILDRESGHAMRGKGAGFITMEINTLGKFNMWGDFQAYEGEYNFKYGGLIDKKFMVKKYGTIRWDGDPMNAILDLQAIYHTDANPSVIVDNSIVSRKVPTDVAIVLNGSLSNPEVDFEISFPTVSSVVKSEIDYKLSDRDTRERQAMALLATGTFFSSNNSSSTLTGSLFERASSIFDDLFSDEDEKFKVGLNYAQGERNPYAQTEGRLGVTFSTKVNDRISVNGKLGVPVGGVEQSVIVGDVEVLLRINEEGTLNARFFNRENDINYIGEGIGYTQGVGVTYEVDFDTFKELISRVLNRALKREKEKNTKSENNRADELPDSDFNRDFIKFYETRRKNNSSQQSE